MSFVRGRVLSSEPGRLVLLREEGTVEVGVDDGGGVRPGDLVVVEDRRARLVFRPRREDTPAARRILDPRRRRGVAIRERVEAEIRRFFLGRGFRETRTPVRVPSPGMEPHIRPFAAGDAFLQTSPEFAMKRLLAGGLERIFQLAPVFRDEPSSRSHRPEFTMLEWYRAWSGYEAIMVDTEELFAHVAVELHGRPVVPFAGRDVDVAPPWPRLRVRDLFQEHAGVDLVADDLRAACARLGLSASADDGWDDLYFRIWLAAVEPALPVDRAVFVVRYPASQAALAVIDDDPDGSRWARRFELYAGGLELGNAFEELTDPVEQRRRFVADLELRARAHPELPASPLPEALLEALEEGMPPSGGIAVGVERMAMLFAGEPDIDYVSWL